MAKNPFDTIKDLSKNSYNRRLQLNEFIHTHTDNLMAWLVGFAFTAISLIISDFGSIKTELKSTAKPIVICFFLTILLGLLCRYVSYLIIVFEKSLEDYFAGVYGDIQMYPIEIDEGFETWDFDTTLERLIKDFDTKNPFPRELNEEEKRIEMPKLKEFYKDYCSISKKQFELIVNHLAIVNETAYKLKKDDTIKAFNNLLKNPKFGYNQKRWLLIRGWLYVFTIISFLAGVAVATIYMISL